MTRPSSPPPVFSIPSLFVLLLSFTLCFGVSGLGSAVTIGPVRSWYPTLTKPALTPPDIAFPIVWTILFALMAVSAWLVWRQAVRMPAGWRAAQGAFALFGLQLALNFGWSLLFFGLRMIGPALVEMLVLLAVLAATIAAFARHSRLAALLLAPYLAWAAFATYLTFMIWRLN
ncbi:TspO/MBR family protein [Ferrovibrio sp.]|uniref:TspO/MBR family protein n=1 Tax=Ferrovibrio sp. TaxID=1917215 RepID=UPI00260753FD|nr:TspO/MBR family protein [Ferrovibrio sp.]